MSEMIALSLMGFSNFVASVPVEVWKALQGSIVANVMSQSTGLVAYITQRKVKQVASATSMVGTPSARTGIELIRTNRYRPRNP